MGCSYCNGASLGTVTYTDFLIFVNQVQDLEHGVFLNVGSAVTGPEVFLKALSMARNVAMQHDKNICRFTSTVFDVVKLPANWRQGPGTRSRTNNGSVSTLYHYRPWKTILIRTVDDGGKSYYVCGDHLKTIPSLWSMLIKEGTAREAGTGVVR